MMLEGDCTGKISRGCDPPTLILDGFKDAIDTIRPLKVPANNCTDAAANKIYDPNKQQARSYCKGISTTLYYSRYY